MDTWISNKGFPLVTVQRNYDNQTITISQVLENIKSNESGNTSFPRNDILKREISIQIPFGTFQLVMFIS